MFTSKCQQQFQYQIYFGSYMKLPSIDTVYLYLLFFTLNGSYVVKKQYYGTYKLQPIREKFDSLIWLVLMGESLPCVS